jgi:hypothetical protein
MNSYIYIVIPLTKLLMESLKGRCHSEHQSIGEKIIVKTDPRTTGLEHVDSIHVS